MSHRKFILRPKEVIHFSKVNIHPLLIKKIIGWARKPKRKQGKRKSEAVINWLREQFNKGVLANGKADKSKKVTARKAAEMMQTLVLSGHFQPDEQLTHQQIQSFFQKEKAANMSKSFSNEIVVAKNTTKKKVGKNK